MFTSFPVIKDPIDYRIINLVNKQRLSIDTLQKVLNIPTEEIREHLKSLHQSHFISCDSTSPLDMCRVSDSFIEKNPIFYELALLQMQKLPLYQDDLMRLNHLK